VTSEPPVSFPAGKSEEAFGLFLSTFQRMGLGVELCQQLTIPDF